MNEFIPAYLKFTERDFILKVEEAEDCLKRCRLCPRECGVDRFLSNGGYCGIGSLPFISSFGPHFGEESPLSGRRGSGTVFFARCNLGCIFCQNYSISHMGEGMELSCERLAAIMTDLQESGCHNINLVTPTHQVPMILRSLLYALKRGLTIPIVYNCGGYESVEVLKILDGIIDIYMPDFKYFDSRYGQKYSLVENYKEIASDAIKEMHRQTGDLITDKQGLAQRGLLLRHLVMPDNIGGSRELVDFIADEISTDTYINIMDQYHPCYKAMEEPAINRRITKKEYIEILEYAVNRGLTRIDKAELRLRFL